MSGLQPGVCEDFWAVREKHLKTIKMKRWDRLQREPAMTLALTNIHSRSEVLARQEQAQSSH
jgi:hypothetical protein